MALGKAKHLAFNDFVHSRLGDTTAYKEKFAECLVPSTAVCPIGVVGSFNSLSHTKIGRESAGT